MSRVAVLKQDFSKVLPTWFQPTPGFKFRDEDGDACIVIGWGGWRDVQPEVVDTSFGRLTGFKVEPKSCALVYSFNYKGEWHLTEVRLPLIGWNWKNGWTEAQEEQLSGWR